MYLVESKMSIAATLPSSVLGKMLPVL